MSSKTYDELLELATYLLILSRFAELPESQQAAIIDYFAVLMYLESSPPLASADI